MNKLLVFLLCAASCLGQTNTARMLSGVNSQTGTTYSFKPADATTLTTFANASAIAATLPAGTTAGFTAGTVFSVQNQGPGTLTITCTGCTITTAFAVSSALILPGGISADIFSGGLNYTANLSGAGVTSSGTLGALAYYLTGGTVGGDPNTSDDGSGNLGMVTWTANGGGPIGGGFDFTFGTTAPTPVAGHGRCWGDVTTNAFLCVDSTGNQLPTQVNGAVLPPSAPVVGTNSNKQLIAATLQGNGSKVQLSTGTTTTNDIVKFDANGNTADSGVACCSGSGTVNSGTSGDFSYYASSTNAVSDSGVPLAGSGTYVVAGPGGTANAVTISTANKTFVWSFIPTVTKTVSNVAYAVNTADNTADLYDVGFYNAGGTVLCHTGATAGTTFAPSANQFSLAVSGTCTLTANMLYFAAITGNATTAKLQGLTALSTYGFVQPSANSTTSGGALNSSVTMPSAAATATPIPTLWFY